MAYTPIARILPQYMDEDGVPYSGAVLKAYAAGTSTPINFSINEAGSTLVATIALNASGYPEVSGNPVMPFLNQTYKIALYPNQAAADSNTGEVWIIDNISLQYFDGGGQEITDIGNGTARNSAIAVGQVQDSQFTYLGTTGGAADTYTLSPSVPITAYAITQHFRAKIHATNLTTTPYLQISSIDDPAVTAVIKKLNASKAEIAVEASDMLTNGIYDFQRNAANNAWIVMNPEKIYLNNQATETILGGAKISSNAQAAAATNDTTIITPLKLPVWFNARKFESSQQTITPAGTLTVAHGLSSVPKNYAAYLVCTDAGGEWGYSQNEETQALQSDSNTTSTASGVAVIPDGTNLNIQFGGNVNVFYVIKRGASAGDIGAITNSKWRVIFRASI